MFCLNNSLEFEHRKLGPLLDFLGRELVWEVSLFLDNICSLFNSFENYRHETLKWSIFAYIFLCKMNNAVLL